MSVGPIPLSRIREYWDRMGLDDEAGRGFEVVIQIMDAEYLRWVSEAVDKQKLSGRPEKPSGWAGRGRGR